MRHSLILLAHVFSMSTIAFAQKPARRAPAPGHTTVTLWPHGAPGAKPNAEPEVDTTTSKDNLIAGKPIIRLGNVSGENNPNWKILPGSNKPAGLALAKAPKNAVPSTPLASPHLPSLA